MSLDLLNDPHRRYNPLTGEWIQVSPHRAKRPWQGKQEDIAEEKSEKFDPECYLCPGNERAGDAQNPDYDGTFVFTNDFSALKPEVPSQKINAKDLLIAKGEKGICRVICFSARHDLTLPEMAPEQVREVVDLWADEYARLRSEERRVGRGWTCGWRGVAWNRKLKIEVSSRMNLAVRGSNCDA